MLQYKKKMNHLLYFFNQVFLCLCFWINQLLQFYLVKGIRPCHLKVVMGYDFKNLLRESVSTLQLK